MDMANVDALQQRLDREDHADVSESLHEVSLGVALDLLSLYAGQATDLDKWLVGAEINSDRNMRLQYLAGLGLNSYEAEEIYISLLEHARYPENLFVATGPTEVALRDLLLKRQKGQ